MKYTAKKMISLILGLVAINIISHYIFKRFDLTQDKRYTLSETSLSILKNAQEPLYIDVFLEGNFPTEFKRLQLETKQILEELKAYNSNIIFQFVNPLENPDEAEAVMQQFYERGLTPIKITVDDKGKQSQEVVYPWAIATYKGKSTKVPLLKNRMGASTEQKIIHSVQHLEYAFIDAFHKITTEKKKKIAIIKGKNELPDILKADFLQTVRDNYFIAPFPLDSAKTKPELIEKALKTFDLAIIAKPKSSFTDAEKQVLDQFVINGGKSLWLIDAVNVSMEDLNQTGSTLAFANNLGLNDLFFKYGLRINPILIKDMQAVRIALATGKKGSETQYQNYPWLYSPFVYTESKHPIVNNIDGVKFEFANPIDTLKNNIKKTILLKSSPYSRTIGTPVEVNLEMVNEKPIAKEYVPGNFPVAVLLEGKFHSVFENRVLAFKSTDFKNVGKETKMIIISDGDIMKNQLDKNGQPMELGFDKWTNQLYANKEFLMNCVNFLLDDNGLINIRSKEVDLPLLDKEKVYEEYTYIQFITVGAPLIILALFGLIFNYLRKRKFAR
ncbi:gliding motility-associated ABC transporter substrate-binding protein GldG [Flavobacterium oreochromis]|uniref:Gliding motility-associated ABC transporter substrate-binding protein GldG n=1 Tax=Flavobacterium oreochromis TaxID=2906078 RepID=A0ABW8P7I6_9FLAO|nr:gliding motility-associated ABC transporter substrate-binding protein GldG [Flavobacterium oreochromis]OWP75106.1 gliding motility-associated ABC transporter substrate-binding protein GldG [Flavobacterium oreochromis]POR23936.1 gliding motility-associated ABC transporter substrate-binding protein GldG [Flavobacterium columnare]QYS86550.1 gliding motility-associated ABC transporter substrate-binding protein GldG [Flavobacterium oreochromis]